MPSSAFLRSRRFQAKLLKLLSFGGLTMRAVLVSNVAAEASLRDESTDL